MILNEVGRIAKKYWLEIPYHHININLDEFVIMPNHVHGIITIVETRHAVPLPTNKFGPLKRGSLSVIIGSYKSAVTRNIRKLHNQGFSWQPRFYDHIIRNHESLEKIQRYMNNNAENWKKDKNNR